MFQIGDRVKSLIDNPDSNEMIHAGSTGEIVRIVDDVVYIEWDDYVCGHNCDGLATDGHGWNMLLEDIAYSEDNEEYEVSDTELQNILGIKS